MNLEDLKYPIGKFEKPAIISRELIEKWIDAIATFPSRLKKEVDKFKNDFLYLKVLQ